MDEHEMSEERQLCQETTRR